MTALLWQQLAELSSDLVFVTDGTGIVVYANSATEILGWKKDELVGAPLTRFFGERHHTSEHRELLESLLEKSAEPETGGVSMTISHEQGIEGEIEARALSFEDAGNDRVMVVIKMLHVSKDFTSYPSSEQSERSDQAELYRLVFESAPVGLIHFDERGVITAANDQFAKIVAASKATLIGLNMTTLPHAELAKCAREAIAGRPAMFKGEYRSILANKVTQAQVQFAPTFNTDGSVSGGVAIVEDVTERERAERALIHAERMASLGALAAGVAHEINNPLAFAMTGVDLSQRLVESVCSAEPTEDDCAKIRATLTDAHEGIERVRMLVRDLKSFARSADERLCPVDIEEVLDIAIKLTRTELRHRSRLLREYIGAPAVLGTESRLVQVFVNLLVNAAHSIEEGNLEKNTITVSTGIDDERRVIVEIRDTGRGIAPKNLDRIFEPFWSGTDDSTTSGLGLSICHGIVTAHGGEIIAESTLGEGTLMRVILPRTSGEDAEDRADRTTLTALPSPLRSLRVFVIDDEVAMCRTLEIGLGNVHTVKVETSGRRALERLISPDEEDLELKKFDVILCDLMLPDLAGPDLYDESVQAIPELASKFIFMTGGAFTEKAKEFLQRVPNIRLEKPFLLAEIEAVLANLK